MFLVYCGAKFHLKIKTCAFVLLLGLRRKSLFFLLGERNGMNRVIGAYIIISAIC
jgi:hypothetical protein